MLLAGITDDVNILGGSVHTVKEKQKIELQIIADKTKYMVMSRDQNAEVTV